jgi:hypothetical protein
MTELKSRRDRILNKIRQAESQSQRASGSVSLLAVSKTWPADKLAELARAGQVDFGENYLQEALEKIATLSNYDLCWHFIGPIQSNKTKDIAHSFDWVHSVDREKIASRLNAQRPDDFPPLNVCIQVNIDNEDSKSGVTAEDLFALAKVVDDAPKLSLRGLMVIPAKQIEHEAQLQSFARAKQLYQQLQKSYASVDTLSMGMSSDMLAAIEQGSTMVRIGTALFGERNYKKQ